MLGFETATCRFGRFYERVSRQKGTDELIIFSKKWKFFGIVSGI